jgi:hypothetical protein
MQRFAVALLFASAISCAREAAAPTEEERVFRQHQFVQAGQPTKFLGEDCSSGGQSDCAAGGVCVHAAAPASSGWVCSALCNSELECPKDWTCFAPVGKQKACWPPQGFTPHRVVVRPAPQSPP